MFELALAMLGCGCALLGWYPRAGRPRRRLLGVLLIHLGCVACGTVSLLLLARLSAPLWVCSVGAWFALLVGVHLGHALAVRHWGAPLHRAVVAYTARNLFQLSRAFPRQALCALVALAGAFAVGAIAATADLLAPTGGVPQLAFVAPFAAIVGLLGAAASWSPRRERLLRDPLLRLFADPRLADFGLANTEPRGGEHSQDHAANSDAGASSPTQGHELSASVRRKATVVLFIVDSLRAPHLWFHGYPRHTAPFLEMCIANRGARAVPLAVSNCVSSECGSWSLLTSRRYRHLGPKTPSLHQVLRRAGYKTRFLLSGIHRGWMGMEALYGGGHDFFLDGVTDTRLIAETARLPAKVQSGGEGDFFCFHLMSVHCSAGLAPRFRAWRPSHNRHLSLGRDADARFLESIVNHYDNTILQADDYIRKILALLEDKGYLRDAVVVVTADHGESLAERPGDFGTLGHANSLFQESIHIPLIIMDTAGNLPETAILADQTDVAPAIADLLGIESPRDWQGRSIFQRPSRATTHVEFVTHPGHLPAGRRRAMDAIIAARPDGIYKLLRHREAGQETFRAAFCLSTDPMEMQPLADDEILAELEAIRRTFVGRSSGDSHLPVAAGAPGRRAA